MLARLAIACLVVQAGCFAPQRPGWERTTYLALATTDAAMLGGVGATLGCGLVTREIWFDRSELSTFSLGCGVAGALASGAGSLYGSLESEREPDRATWIAVSLPLITTAAILVIAGYNRLVGKRGR